MRLLTAIAALLAVLTPLVCPSEAQSLRVGDYDEGSNLPDGASLPLYTLTWRAIGHTFAFSNFKLNTTFTSDANTAFGEAPHQMIYTALNIQDAAAFNTTRSLNGQAAGAAVNQIFDTSLQPQYSSVDLLMRATFTQNSIWDDLGVTHQAYRQAISSILGNAGWNMTAVVPMVLEIASDAAGVLSNMPLPAYSSYQLVLQVSGANLVPTSLQTQNLITEVLLDLLASDHVFLIRLTSVDETSSSDGSGTAKMTYIMQKNSETSDISVALALVLGNPATQGSQQRSAFTTTMASNNLTATAMVLSENQIFNDSIGDQIYALTTPTSHGSSKKHLGAIIGSTVGSASALLILLAVFAAYGRGWLRSRKLNRRAAASTKDDSSDVEAGRPELHDSGSSLALNSSSGAAGQSEAAAAAKCWDIDAADIALCCHADGTDWLLSSTESGQVFKAVKGGVQDVVVKVLSSRDSELATKDLRKEVDILKSVSYDRNVVQFYGTCLWGDKTMLVLEYMEGGDLRQALTNSRNGEMKWQNKGAVIALDIVRGLHYLHSHQVMHMDLKASNVLLTQTYGIAKIGDVGLAQVMGSSRAGRPRPATFAYSAPELILNGTCTEKVDMYSFGVILWELITTEMARRGRLRAIQVPQECPLEIEQLIDMCLATDPADRPTAKQAFDVISACSGPAAVSAHPAVPPTPNAPALNKAAAQAAVDDSHANLGQSQQQQQQQVGLAYGSHQQQEQVGLAHWNNQQQEQAGLAHRNNQQHAHAEPDEMAEASQAIEPPSLLMYQHEQQTTLPFPGNVRQPPTQVVVDTGQLQQSRTHAEGHSAAPDLGDVHPPPPPGQEAPSGGYDTAAGLPTGVLGHLYPSPFAIAADASSGPLWDWQTAAVV